MKILLDTADINDIGYFCENYPVIGVTTNPTILSRVGGDVVSRLLEIRKLLTSKYELHVQVTEQSYDKIIEEAHAIVNLLGDNTFVKIPISDVGLHATKTLTSQGINVTATAILTATQAMLAAEAGAVYVAPYVSRLDNIMADGVGTVSQIAEIFKIHSINSKILAASFKTASQVLEVALVGAHCATVSTDILHLLSSHPTTTTSIEGFDKDFKSAFNKMTLLELIKKNSNKF